MLIDAIHVPGDPVGDILFHWSPLIVLGLVCLFGIVLLFLGFRGYAKASILKKAGEKGDAVVTRKWIKEGYVRPEERHRIKPTKSHFLRFERGDGDARHAEEEIAPIDLWRAVEPGDTVEVIYLRGGSMMRLAATSSMIGHGAGIVQMVAGALMTAGAIGGFVGGAVAAAAGPDYRTAGPDWVADRAEILGAGPPADPFLRLFAADARWVEVVFGDTQGGALMANTRRILLKPDQASGQALSEGEILDAWIDPANEFNAILDLERDPAAP
ncbi:MAG: DUF3592 domain-containing protein [Pseudomonadota bacterium]